MSYERELELTAERLRRLPSSRLLPEQDAVYSLLSMMTERPVPSLRPVAWGDQLWVIGCEVPADRRAAVIPALQDLRRCFDLTM